MQVSKARGFTLIELLVVIAIIAILAAILFPVFAQAREKARAATAQSNEKQVTLALLMYVQDYDEMFPQYQYSRLSGDPQYGKPNLPEGIWQDHYLGWDEVVLPYIKNAQVFKDPDFDDGNDATNPQKDDSDWTGSDNFCMNSNIDGYSAPLAKLANLDFPASTILLGETGRNASTGATCGLDGNTWGWAGDHKQRLQWGDQTEETGTTITPALLIHTGGGEYAFSDGHVKWIRGSATGLLANGTATDQSVDPLMGKHDGSFATYCLSSTGCSNFGP